MPMIGNDIRRSDAGEVTNVMMLKEEKISAVVRGAVPCVLERTAESI
jgi:hypothetical protein